MGVVFDQVHTFFFVEKYDTSSVLFLLLVVVIPGVPRGGTVWVEEMPYCFFIILHKDYSEMYVCEYLCLIFQVTKK